MKLVSFQFVTLLEDHVIELTLSRTGHTAKKMPTCIVPINFISPFLSSKNIERSFVFDDWGKCKVGAVFILINWIISYLCPFWWFNTRWILVLLALKPRFTWAVRHDSDHIVVLAIPLLVLDFLRQLFLCTDERKLTLLLVQNHLKVQYYSDNTAVSPLDGNTKI